MHNNMIATQVNQRVNELEQKELLTSEEFKELGYYRMSQMIRP